MSRGTSYRDGHGEHPVNVSRSKLRFVLLHIKLSVEWSGESRKTYEAIPFRNLKKWNTWSLQIAQGKMPTECIERRISKPRTSDVLQNVAINLTNFFARTPATQLTISEISITHSVSKHFA